MSSIHKILITGGAGFIGSHLAERFLREGISVVIVDNLSSGKQGFVDSLARFYKLDILDPDFSDIVQKEKPDIIFHFAAQINARRSTEEPFLDAKINILGSLNVLEACRRVGVQKIVFASSGGEIYGNASELPTPESYNTNPLSPYGVAKLAVENYLYSYSQLYGIRPLIFRFGNIYGPRQNPKSEAGVVAIFLTKILQGEPPIVHGDGKQSKDYVFISDAIEAISLGIRKDAEGIFNVGTGTATSVIEILNTLKDLCQSTIQEIYSELPSGSFPRGCLDNTRARQELGWIPQTSFREGARQTKEWFEKNQDFWKK